MSLEGFPAPMNAIVVGAGGGIGNALAQELVSSTGVANLYCTARHPDRSPGIQSLVSQHDTKVHPLAVDLLDENSLKTAAEEIASLQIPIHAVINCAGILSEGDQLQPERRLREVQPVNLERSFAVNAYGPLLLAKHFGEFLPREGRSLFASLSARVGSIGDNRLGGWYAYRASKAAHNMFIKTVSIELRRRAAGLICVALHPGTVDTPLSQPFQASVRPEKLFTPRLAAAQLISVLNNLSDDANGGFYAWDGQPIPW